MIIPSMDLTLSPSDIKKDFADKEHKLVVTSGVVVGGGLCREPVWNSEIHFTLTQEKPILQNMLQIVTKLPAHLLS